MNAVPDELPRLMLPITTDRLILRDYVIEDVPAVRQYMQDPAHWAFQLDAAPSNAQIDALLQRIGRDQLAPARQAYFLGVALKDQPDQVIGEGLLQITSPAQRQGEIGFGVTPALWGRGYAGEIARAMLAAAFTMLKLHHVIARTSTENVAALRVMENAGLTREGIMRDLLFARGKWWSTAIYGMVEDEYAAQGTFTPALKKTCG